MSSTRARKAKLIADDEGWYTSSVAESENKSLVDARSLDPFNALLAIVQQCGADRSATRETADSGYRRLTPQSSTRSTCPEFCPQSCCCSRTPRSSQIRWRLPVLRGEELIFHQCRSIEPPAPPAASRKQVPTVSLKRYECCPLLKVRSYPCHHVCHVRSVAKLRVADFMPQCHTTTRPGEGSSGAARLVGAAAAGPLPTDEHDDGCRKTAMT